MRKEVKTRGRGPEAGHVKGAKKLNFGVSHAVSSYVSIFLRKKDGSPRF